MQQRLQHTLCLLLIIGCGRFWSAGRPSSSGYRSDATGRGHIVISPVVRIRIHASAPLTILVEIAHQTMTHIFYMKTKLQFETKAASLLLHGCQDFNSGGPVRGPGASKQRRKRVA